MKAKILVVHERFGFLGGAEQSIYCASEYLKEYYTLSFLYSLPTQKREELYKTPFSHLYQVDFTDPDEVTKGKVRTVLSNENPQLIYVHKCLSGAVLEVLLESGLPIVRMVHDHEIYCIRGYKYYPISRCICKKKAGLCCLFPGLAFLERDETGRFHVKNPHYFEKKRLTRLDQQCTAFFAGSEYMCGELINQGYDPKRVVCVPPVVPLKALPSLPLSSKKNTLIFAGQLVRGKGLDCLIRALALVKAPFKLLVMGQGSHQPYCQQLVNQFHLQESVEFLGFVPHEKMAHYYAEALMGVVPSVWPEPFGMVGLEFMHAGLPVIGFDSGGIQDWLKDNLTGYLIPWMDIQKMAEKIDYLLTHQEKASELGREGQKYAETHFQFEEHMKKLHTEFGRILTTETQRHGEKK